jgi:predicted membrane GTPase involved in stress response
MEGPDGKPVKGRINQVLTFQGLERVQATEAGPGEIVLINGIDGNRHWRDGDRPPQSHAFAYAEG